MSDRAASDADWRLPPAGTRGGDPACALRLNPVLLAETLEIAAWPDRLEATATRLAQVSGTALPQRPGVFTASDAGLLCWLAFGRFLWLGAPEAAAVAGSLAVEDAATVDLGHARAALRLAGAPSAAVLNKAVAIDFDPAVFPAGCLAQTTIHHVPVLILRRSEAAFDCLAPSSFATAIAEWLTDAALEYGYEVGTPLGLLSEP